MNEDRIRLRHLRTFVAIAERGSLVKAADMLSITQPAVTKTLAELESIVGQRLVERARQGMRLTACGHVFLMYAGSSLRTLREGLDRIARFPDGDAPIVAVGALPAVSSTILPTIVKRFAADNPRARVKISTGSNSYLLALLRQGDLDCVIGRLAEPSEMRGLSFELLYCEELAFAVRPGHPLVLADQLSTAMLLQYCLILPDRGARTREPADRFFVAAGLPLPDHLLETIDPQFARSYALLTDAVWCAPAGVVENDFRIGALVRLALKMDVTSGEVGLTLRADRTPSDALQRLLVELRAASAQRLTH